MNIKHLLLTIMAGGLLSACETPVRVDSDYDTDVNFADYKTYRWHAPTQANQQTMQYLQSDLMDNRIRTAIERELQEKGYTRQDTGDVDFLVNYSISTQEKTDVKTYNTYSGFAPGWGGGWYGPGPYYYSGVGVGFNVGTSTSNTTVDHWQQGTLIVDVVHPDDDKLVWRGTAVGRVPEHTTQQEKDEIVNSVVGQVLRRFPPQP